VYIRHSLTTNMIYQLKLEGQKITTTNGLKPDAQYAVLISETDVFDFVQFANENAGKNQREIMVLWENR
jgi:hypothetical protein